MPHNADAVKVLFHSIMLQIPAIPECRRNAAILLAIISVFTTCVPIVGRGQDKVPASQSSPVYPLKKSSNGRYLVDQKNRPFLIAGDAPQALMVNTSESDADFYFANRKSHGFNAVWINLLCRPGTGGRKDGSTYDGILPFTVPDDLSTPNEAYFTRSDRMIKLAAKHDILVILDPCETIDHLKLMVANGPEKCRSYGRYLGKRHKSFNNILWMSGNDFQTWKDPKNDAAATAVALGIREEDKRHIHTVELDYLVSGSLDDPNWAPIVSLSAAYTYYPTYAEVLKEYNRPNFQPVVMIEADYEFEQKATPVTLRRQEYWTNLSGATGHVYGNGYIWPFKPDWKDHLDTPGAKQIECVKELFEPRAWSNLVPDQDHTVVTAGYGTLDTSNTEQNRYVQSSDYVTAARTSDGSLMMAYMPTSRSISVDMTRLRGRATASWFDPSRGIYTEILGSPFQNAGSKTFTPPGKNGDGDDDWVLILETKPSRAMASGRTK
jgi:hypothetical protein